MLSMLSMLEFIDKSMASQFNEFHVQTLHATVTTHDWSERLGSRSLAGKEHSH